jgi:hypothetical protein
VKVLELKRNPALRIFGNGTRSEDGGRKGQGGKRERFHK